MCGLFLQRRRWRPLVVPPPCSARAAGTPPRATSSFGVGGGGPSSRRLLFWRKERRPLLASSPPSAWAATAPPRVAFPVYTDPTHPPPPTPDTPPRRWRGASTLLWCEVMPTRIKRGSNPILPHPMAAFSPTAVHGSGRGEARSGRVPWPAALAARPSPPWQHVDPVEIRPPPLPHVATTMRWRRL